MSYCGFFKCPKNGVYGISSQYRMLPPYLLSVSFSYPGMAQDTCSVIHSVLLMCCWGQFKIVL